QGPLDVTTDPEGHVFVLDSQAAGKIQEFSSSGALLEAWNIPSVHQYAGIAADSTGRVYLADGRHVQVYSTAGKLLSRWGGGGTAPGQLAAPAGIAAGPQGNVFVADTGNNRVQKFSTNGRVIAVWSRPFRRPAGIAVDGGGNILVADTGNNRLLELSPAGHIVAAWTTAGGVPFSAPRGVAVGRNETIYLADTGNHRILRLAPQAATFVTLFPTGPWVKPVSLAVDREGRVYVGEMQDVTHATGAVLVQALTPAGKPIPSWRPSRGPLWYSQTGVAVDARGDVFATDSDSYRAGNFGVWEYSRTGRLLRRWGPAGNGPGEFDFPQAVSSGPGGTVFAADTGNNRVQVLRPGS
ncbi:MAG TPA: NHL repeat-containing protein, partial [Chloroflexota bacterium]|nr:NHL repeat-containing protein [Chloroflexota bacterium]